MSEVNIACPEYEPLIKYVRENAILDMYKNRVIGLLTILAPIVIHIENPQDKSSLEPFLP